LADLAAGDAVVHPEAAHALVATAQGEAVRCLRVREEGAVEVEPEPPRPRPVDPAGEVLGSESVALDRPAARLGVDGVQVEAVPAGDQAQGFFQVAAQLVGVARLAGVVAGRLDAAAGQAEVVLEAADVVALPAVQGYRDCGEDLQGPVAIDAEGGVALAG